LEGNICLQRKQFGENTTARYEKNMMFTKSQKRNIIVNSRGTPFSICITVFTFLYFLEISYKSILLNFEVEATRYDLGNMERNIIMPTFQIDLLVSSMDHRSLRFSYNLCSWMFPKLGKQLDGF
jgi:hypothetical protein